MDQLEAITIAACIQELPPDMHKRACKALTESRLGYIFEADGDGEVTVKMSKTAFKAKWRLMLSISNREMRE